MASVPLSLIIIEGFRARRENIGNSTLQTLHSEIENSDIRVSIDV